MYWRPTARFRRQYVRSEEHTSELQSHLNLVCRLLLEKKKKKTKLHQTALVACLPHSRTEVLTTQVNPTCPMTTPHHFITRDDTQPSNAACVSPPHEYS